MPLRYTRWPLLSLFSEVRDMAERDELVACPGTILRAIARILIDRCMLCICFSLEHQMQERKRTVRVRPFRWEKAAAAKSGSSWRGVLLAFDFFSSESCCYQAIPVNLRLVEEIQRLRAQLNLVENSQTNSKLCDCDRFTHGTIKVTDKKEPKLVNDNFRSRDIFD